MRTFISVQIIARETGELGRRLFLACLECLVETNYADEIIIVDDGCSAPVREMYLQVLVDAPCLRKIDTEPKSRNFCDLRNRALAVMSDKATHLHWIDTDECYPPETLDNIRKFLESDVGGRIDVLRTTFAHFMIDPDHVQFLAPKDNVFRVVPGLQWNNKVHEKLSGGSRVHNGRQGHFLYHHYGYIRPQWQTALKWMYYDLVEHGHVDGYRRYYDEGRKEVVPYYSDGRTPDQCVNDRSEHCQEWALAHTNPFISNLHSKWNGTGNSWREFLEEIEDHGPWAKWKTEREERGDWESTLAWACEELLETPERKQK